MHFCIINLKYYHTAIQPYALFVCLFDPVSMVVY